MYRLPDGRKPIKKWRHTLIAILVLLLAYAILQYLIPTAGANSEPIYIEHTVQGGGTLWSIARHYRPDADPRQIVWEIRQINGITPEIRPGQVLLVQVKP